MKRIRTQALLSFFTIAFAFSTPLCATASFGKPSADSLVSAPSYLKLVDYLRLSTRDLAALTGKKMSFWDKVSFHVMKQKMKRAVKNDPGILMSEYYNRAMNKRLSAGWWVLIGVGALIFLGLILFAIALGSINHTG